MKKRIRQSGALMISLLPLAGCLSWLDVADEIDGHAPASDAPPVYGPPQGVTGASGSAPLSALCGEDRFADVVESACAQERGLCEQWAECASVSTPLDDCIAEREAACQQRVLVALQGGACFLPQISAINDNNGCHDAWQRTQGSCLIPTMQELIVMSERCRDEWGPGQIPEGGACMYGAAGCAETDELGRRIICAMETSFEPGGGVCRSIVDVSRGAACDPDESDFCNRLDGCLSSGICDQRRALGDACAADNDCASLLCADGVCTDPEGFSCAERSCPVLWSCEEQRCTRRSRT